jgi:integrase
MPIKLIPPRKGFTPNYYGRGTYLGIFVDRSTGTDRKPVAKKIIAGWERDIERGRFETRNEATFLIAATAYMRANANNDRPLKKLIQHAPLAELALSEVRQAAIDATAAALFPDATAATRNREVYTPISAVLKHAGSDFRIRRPKGSRGRELAGWLWPEEAERLLAEAVKIEVEFGLLCLVMLCTGLRRSEATLWFTCNNLRMGESFALIPRTKNGEPRPVYLPPQVVAALGNHPRGLDRGTERVFRYHPGGRLYTMLYEAAERAGVVLPDRSAFHIFRHTYGAWMRRYAGSDTSGLVATGAWKSRQSAARYEHAVVSEEAQKSIRLPALKLFKAG